MSGWQRNRRIILKRVPKVKGVAGRTRRRAAHGFISGRPAEECSFFSLFPLFLSFSLSLFLSFSLSLFLSITFALSYLVHNGRSLEIIERILANAVQQAAKYSTTVKKGQLLNQAT